MNTYIVFREKLEIYMRNQGAGDMLEFNENSGIGLNPAFEKERTKEAGPRAGEVSGLPPWPWETIMHELTEVQGMLRQTLIANEQREGQLETVCKELQAERDRMADQVIDGILLDVIALKEKLEVHVDDFSELTGLLISEAEKHPMLTVSVGRCRRMLHLLREVEALVQDILYKNQVESFSEMEINLERQQILHNKLADYVASEPRKYVETVKPGYTRGGRVIRKQLVDVIHVESYENFEILDVLNDAIPQRRTDLMQLAEEGL